MKERLSNIELLRIVCMLCIVLHHCTQYVMQRVPETMLSLNELIALDVLDMFAFVGVNAFVLISGYFAIRPKWTNFWGFYIQCAFYCGVLYLAYLWVNGIGINRWCLYNTIMPFSHHPGLWFLPAYLFLYIVSPLLNKLTDNLSKKDFHTALILLTILNVYYGFYRQFEFNPNGHSLSNFIFLYFIGRYLRLHFVWNVSETFQKYAYLLLFIIGSLLLGGLRILGDFNIWISKWSCGAILDCHPLLIFNAIALLLFFTKVKIQSRVINWISSSMLAVYILHANKYFNPNVTKLVANTYMFLPPPIFVSLHYPSLH